MCQQVKPRHVFDALEREPRSGSPVEVKRLAFLDLLKEEAEKSAEHADEQFDADFALMTGELSRFLPQLVTALGGEVVEEK